MMTVIKGCGAAFFIETIQCVPGILTFLATIICQRLSIAIILSFDFQGRLRCAASYLAYIPDRDGVYLQNYPR